MKKILYSVISLVISICFYFALSYSQWGEEGSWDTQNSSGLLGWNGQQAITVDNSSGAASTNYPVLITFISTDATVLGSNGQDLRFLRGSTQDYPLVGVGPWDIQYVDSAVTLRWWRESWNATDGYKVWVKVDSIPVAASITLQCYFGNSQAADSSNINTVFLEASDFNQISNEPTIVNFTAISKDTVMFGRGAAGTWDDAWIREHGNVLYNPDITAARRYISWYTGGGTAVYNNDSSHIGQVVSADGRIWAKEGTGLIDTVHVNEDPHVVFYQDTLFMYAEDRPQPAVPVNAISMRWSADWGVSWTYYGIVMDSSYLYTFMNLYLASPTVLMNNDTLFLIAEAKGTCGDPPCSYGHMTSFYSVDMRNFTLIDTITTGGAPGGLDAAGDVPDCLFKYGNLFYLIGHAQKWPTPDIWRTSIRTSASLYANTWTHHALSVDESAVPNPDPQFFQDVTGAWHWTGIDESINTFMYYGNLYSRADSTFPDTSFVLIGRGDRACGVACGPIGFATNSGGTCLLVGDSYVRSSSTLRTKTSTFVQDFIVEARMKFLRYNDQARFNFCIGSTTTVDNSGSTTSWEDTHLQSGYFILIHPTSQSLWRMPAAGTRVQLSTFHTNSSLGVYQTYGLSYESADDSLKLWQQGVLKPSGKDATFDASAKYVGLAQGKLGTSWSGGDCYVQWLRVRPFQLPEPVVTVIP